MCWCCELVITYKNCILGRNSTALQGTCDQCSTFNNVHLQIVFNFNAMQPFNIWNNYCCSTLVYKSRKKTFNISFMQ